MRRADMIWIALVAFVLAVGTYTETDWEYGTNQRVRRARAFGWIMAVVAVVSLMSALVS